MAISIKGVNTGVIRKSNNFIALALKIKEPRNKESLFFMSVMELRDLLIALESRMHQKHKLDAAARLQYEQARDKVIKKMAIWNMTPIPNRNGNITCSTIIWRCFTALKMKVAKNNLAAQW